MTDIEFQEQTIAMLNVQTFLLTAILRSQFAAMPPDKVESTITALLRDFSTLVLPATARTDEATLRAVSARHARSQDMLRQVLDFARPRAGAGSSGTGRT